MAVGTRLGSWWTMVCLNLFISGCATEVVESALHPAIVVQPIVNGDRELSQSLLPDHLARSVGALEDAYGTLRCTGVLIEDKWVISAAHCVGEGLVFRSPVDAHSPTIPLEAPLYHPVRDLALMRVRDSFSLSKAELPFLRLRSDFSDAELRIGATAVLSGVGLTESGSRGQLSVVREEVVAIDDLLITVDGHGMSGACTGDSGGPLFADVTGTGTLELVGILSKGAASCRGRDWYTRVASVLEWIANTTGKTRL